MNFLVTLAFFVIISVDSTIGVSVNEMIFADNVVVISPAIRILKSPSRLRRVNPYPCTPRTNWSDGCNDCSCSADGKTRLLFIESCFIFHLFSPGFIMCANVRCDRNEVSFKILPID